MTMTDQDYATLTARLVLPLAVREVLESARELDDESHIALHEILSEMKPDAALLSIAISAKMIAASYTETEILIDECDRIIREYGSVWLENARHGHIDNTYLVSLLEKIPEDLEGLTELIEVNLSYAALESAAVSDICEIFQIQASAHAIIAEEYMNIMEMAHNTGFGAFYTSSELMGNTAQTMSENIVPFRT